MVRNHCTRLSHVHSELPCHFLFCFVFGFFFNVLSHLGHKVGQDCDQCLLKKQMHDAPADSCLSCLLPFFLVRGATSFFQQVFRMTVTDHTVLKIRQDVMLVTPCRIHQSLCLAPSTFAYLYQNAVRVNYVLDTTEVIAKVQPSLSRVHSLRWLQLQYFDSLQRTHSECCARVYTVVFCDNSKVLKNSKSIMCWLFACTSLFLSLSVS